MQKLPTGNFKLLNVQQRDKYNVLSISNESDTGRILEVDLQYSSKIYDGHSDLPFAAEQFVPLRSTSKVNCKSL